MEQSVIGRLSDLNRQFAQQSTSTTTRSQSIILDDKTYLEVIDYEPHLKIKLDYFNKQGWGYKDTQFELDKNRSLISFTGTKYLYSGKELPEFFPWATREVRLDYKNQKIKQDDMEVDPPKNLSHEFLNELITEKSFSRLSFEKWERIMHSHGASLREVFALRYGRFERYVDLVVYPTSTLHIQKIIELADKYNVMIVPYGGGTNVTQALWLKNSIKDQATKMIVSLDMSRMNKILWVDKDNMIACVQAGIRGQDLERELRMQGVITGHEPDSAEFSTLGGWISTRASGMKKNTYGNIEDIVQAVTFVTPKGTFKKADHWPRVSSGPDFSQLIIGHEGNFGVVSEAIVKVKLIPEVQEFGSIVFPNFTEGAKFMEEMSKQRLYPTSIRLVDNIQFHFGQALKPAEPSATKRIINDLKKKFLLHVKGFKPDEMVAATCLFEGQKTIVQAQMKNCFEIAAKYGGLSGGAENGIKGYQLTYMIAYIRDFCLLNNVVAESFETSCPWSQVIPLCKNVRQAIYDAGAVHGFKKKDMFVSFRITQLYETGAAVYVYFSITYDSLPMEKVCDVYEDIEHRSREATLAYGGSISHHHGIGKLRKRFMDQTLAPLNSELHKGFKKAVDPNNIFGINNTIYLDEAEKEKELNH